MTCFAEMKLLVFEKFGDFKEPCSPGRGSLLF